MNATVLIIAQKEFRDRLRSGWIVACVLVWLGAISLTSLFGLIQIGHIGMQGYERTAMSLLNLAQYLVPLLGLLVGHDLVVREREDRTLNLILASGVTRTRLLVAKFVGGVLTVSVPLVLGFIIAGVLVGVAARDRAFAAFLKLALSGLALGIAFNGIGLLISTFSRSRVQALVCALLAWGVAVFAFDLVALGVIVSTKATQASHEIDVVCDATHVNNQADIHAAFDGNTPATKRSEPGTQRFTWLWLNPVDVFRVLNLPSAQSLPLPWSGAATSMFLWVLLCVGAAAWRLERADL